MCTRSIVAVQLLAPDFLSGIGPPGMNRLKCIPWFTKKRRLITSPIKIAQVLHQIMAEEDNPQGAPEAFELPRSVHARFPDKVVLYREANVLLALLVRT